MDDEELLRQMLLQSMQAATTNEDSPQESSIQRENVTTATNNNTASSVVVESGAREEGEISDEEGGVTPDEEPHSPENQPRDANTNESNTVDRSHKYISIDSDEDDYSKLLKNYEKKLDPESDTKDDERRGGRRNEDWSPRSRRGFNNMNDRRRDRNTRRPDRSRRNYRDGGYYDDRPQNPAPNPAINPAFLLQTLVNYIGNTRPLPPPGNMPPMPPALHMPPYPSEPYPQHSEPYGAGDMDVDPPTSGANFSAQPPPFNAPINSAQYVPQYPPPGPYFNNYEPSYNNYTVPLRPAMTPVTQPPLRPVTAVTSPKKIIPTQPVSTPSVTPVTTEVSNQHEDEDRLVIDLGELEESSEDSSDSDRSNNADTEDWMLNITRIKQQLAEKEKRHAKNSTQTANAAATTTTITPSEEKSANDKQALVEKEQQQSLALAEKEQRIQRLKHEIARRERELQNKKQASTREETRGEENSVNESVARVEARDQQPMSSRHEKRPRSQSDPHRLDDLRAVKRARVTREEREHDNSAAINSNTLSAVTAINGDTPRSSPHTSKNSALSRVMTLEDRARVLREKSAEEHAVNSARDERNKLNSEFTATHHEVQRSRAQLTAVERNIVFLEEKLRAAREERDKLFQIRKDQERRCHVLEEHMREIDRDMERRLSVIAEHDHVLKVNDLQIEMDQSESSADTTPMTEPDTSSNLGQIESTIVVTPVISKPSTKPPVTLPNKEIEVIDVDDEVSTLSLSGTLPVPDIPIMPGASHVSASDEDELRRQALNALNSPLTSKAERRRARRKLHQHAASGGTAGTAAVPVTVPTPAQPAPGRPSDTTAPFMNETEQQIVTKVRALRGAVSSSAVLVHDWRALEFTEQRTHTLTGLDDHVIVDYPADIPHVPADAEGADYSAVLQSLASTDESAVHVAASQLAVPYHSPLSAFSSYRLAPHFPHPRTAVAWSNKMDPHTVLCKYDLHGTCNDDECHAQHAREYQLSAEELLHDLASYIEDPTKSRAENESAVSALLKRVRGTILTERVDSLIALVNQQLRARDPEHRGIVFTPRHKSPRKAVPHTAHNRRDKRAGKSAGEGPRDTVLNEDEDDVLVVEELHDDEQPLLHLIDNEHAQLMAHTQHERYFHPHLSSHQVEQLCLAQPHNVALWLQYSVTQLHEHVPHSLSAPLLWDAQGHWLDATQLIVRELTSDSSATTPSESSVDAALHVLSRALEHNRRSVALWYYYLRLYIPRAQSREELIRTIDQGLSFTAENADNTNWTLWCLYIDAHVALHDKIVATELAVTRLARDSSPELAARSSIFALQLVLDSIQLQISLGHVIQARDRLRGYIYHATGGGKVSLRALLQPRHLELAVLAYIHVFLFDHVPNLTNHVLSAELFVIDWEKARDKPVMPQLNRLFKDAAEFPEFRSRDYVPVSLMTNHVLHVQHQPETAKVLVQDYLKLHPSESALWHVYALVESAQHKEHVVALIYQQALTVHPRDWRLWYLRAMHTLTRDASEVLACIAAAALGLAPAPLNQMVVRAEDKQSLAVTRSLFVTALQMTRDTAEHFTPFTGTLVDSSSYADNVYLWLLFCLFEMITGRDEHVQHVINQGSERLTDPQHRIKLWLFYVTWRSKHATSSEQLVTAVQGLVHCHVRTVHELTQWHRSELAHEVSESDAQRMHVPVHVDYSALNHVLQSSLRAVPSVQQRIEFLEQCCFALPQHTFAARLLARVQWEQSLFNRAKSSLLTALLRTPLDTALWLDLAHINMLQSRVPDASHVLSTAVRVVQSVRLVATALALLALTHNADLSEHVLALLTHLRARECNLKPFEDKIFRKSAFAPWI